MTIVDNYDEVLNEIKVGAQCDVFIGESQLISGYIYKKTRSISENSSSVNISGRCKTSDLIDCAAIKTGNTWENSFLIPIVKDICKPFGISIVSKNFEDNLKFKKFTIESGETAFESIERACRQRSVLCTTNEKGELVLNTISKKTLVESADNLIYGENIKSIDEDFDSSERFSKYIIKGQDSGEGNPWDKTHTQLSATANDQMITRYRPTIIMSEAKASLKSVKARANWEAQVRAGRSASYSVTVQGFRQKSKGSNSPLWQLGNKVNLIHHHWNINDVKLISNISYTLDESGSQTMMTLVDVNTYSASPDGEVRF
jgi:prophage tail gpP-like protein